MATIRRLTDSCLTVTDDAGTTLFDPGFHTFADEAVRDSIGDVQRVLITHEHRDHVAPDFVRWLLDRGDDVTVHANDAVVDLLAGHDIPATGDAPTGTAVEDVMHEPLPTGARPTNRSWTIDGLFTHPGDSYQPSRTAPVLALPLMTPWGSATAAMDFARRVRPAQVVPVHDFYLDQSGREWIASLAKGVLAEDGIEVVTLGWGEQMTT